MVDAAALAPIAAQRRSFRHALPALERLLPAVLIGWRLVATLQVVKLPIAGVRQIKLPVTDLARRARWYADLFDLELANEFFENSAVRGVVLADHDAGFVIGLRERAYCASSPVLDGFDVCAFMIDTPAQMSRVIARCDELGIAHGDVHDRGEFGIAMDVADPDGTILRFVAGPHTGPPGTFAGIEFASGPPTIYDQPRLSF